MNHYPRHAGDFTADTIGLSLEEFGAYNRLIDWYYLNERPIPSDVEAQARLSLEGRDPA